MSGSSTLLCLVLFEMPKGGAQKDQIPWLQHEQELQREPVHASLKSISCVYIGPPVFFLTSVIFQASLMMCLATNQRSQGA